MNEDSFKLAEALVPGVYVSQGLNARRSHEKQIRALLYHRKLPEEGWEDTRIKMLLQDLSIMDSNNFPGKIGVGEREGRIVSRLVQDRHYGFSHGVGRSGDVAAVQPKAAGSSVLAKLTNELLVDLMQRMGTLSVSKCVLVPAATGMSLMLVLLTLRQQRPKASYVVWPRIDQKSCFKCMLSAGCTPVIVENLLVGDELQTDVAGIGKAVEEHGADNIVCVFTTTSCFAPRSIDRVSEVAVLCAQNDVPHIINNAYGVQSRKCMVKIENASRAGRVDAFVQSTDKNFMVPVGGAIVASSDADFVAQVAETYPGRGSSTPALDVFVTLLSLGWAGYSNLVQNRQKVYDHLLSSVRKVAEDNGERVMVTQNNPISIGVTLSSLTTSDARGWTELGSMLFCRGVSGVRVVAPGNSKQIGSYKIENWGAHFNGFTHPYLTVAAGVGMATKEVDEFCKKLEQCITKWRQRHPKPDTKTSIKPDTDTGIATTVDITDKL